MPIEFHIISPTGCVHIATAFEFDGKSFRYATLCKNQDNNKFLHAWDRTEKAVTCRHCLAKSDNVKHRIKELAIKASDLETDFHLIACKCEHFHMEDKENADIFHALPWRLCSHKRHLQTKKHPAHCLLLNCPLKYER